jgi:hypothetical protein
MSSPRIDLFIIDHIPEKVGVAGEVWLGIVMVDLYVKISV